MKFKNIFLGLIAGTILTASLTACTSTKNPDDNTKPTETETIEKINEPYSDTDPSTWKDLTEPSFLYPHWQTYNKWPSWYNPLRPWEKEGSVNFDFSQIMLEDYNGEGDAITWDGRVIPNGYNGEPLDPLNIVHSQLYTYIENITTQDTHEEQCSHVYGYLTKERILEEYNLYKPTNERYYLQSISYYYEDENKNPLSTSQSFYPDYEKEYEYNYLYNSEINAYKESKKFDAL